MSFTLKADGDPIEQAAESLFLKAKLPSYEKFWQNFVAPVTQRPSNIRFKTDLMLQADYPNESVEELHERLCISQLHYSALNFLIAAFEGKNKAGQTFDGIEKCFSALYSALDISAELFGRYARFKNKITIPIDAFVPNSIEDAMAVRRQWQKAHPYPSDVQTIRDYRDNLIHGRMMFYYVTPQANYIGIPKLGKEREYLDWRKALEAIQTGTHNDLAWSDDMTNRAFDSVIKYLEITWQQELLTI